MVRLFSLYDLNYQPNWKTYADIVSVCYLRDGNGKEARVRQCLASTILSTCARAHLSGISDRVTLKSHFNVDNVKLEINAIGFFNP